MPPFLQRLKQRKIVQWAIAYFAGAWVSLEVFDMIAEQFLWPAWIRQAATVLVLFGGLITVVIAWYHGERGRQKVGVLELLLVVVILGLGGQSVWVLKNRSDSLALESATAPFQFREKPLPEHSVAVLPCSNLSDDEGQGYFADGLASELITRLAAVSGLRIPSHTSSFGFRGKNVTLEAVAAALRVRHVLECDIFGDETRIRIGARLIDTQTGYTLWSESYNRARSRLIDVQQEVAEAVVQNLEIRLVDRERLLIGRRWTDSTEAYDEFLQGIRLQEAYPDQERMAISLKHLQRAVELDPDFGRAYARIAIHWIIMGNYGYAPSKHAYDETERLARQAIELDGELFEAHWALGWAQVGRFDWQEGEASFRRVIELAPGNYEGYHSLGMVQGTLGRYAEAMTAAQIATNLDPLSYRPWLGMEFLYTRQRAYEDSIRVKLESATRNGWDDFTRASMALLLALAGRNDEARTYLLEVEAENSQDANVQLTLAGVYIVLGEPDRALSLVKPLRQRYQNDPDQIMPGALAWIYAGVGDYDQAMEFLLAAREQEDANLWFLDDAFFDGLRADPRFMELIRGLSLPEKIYLSPVTGDTQ
jgi:TolB-like protein/thioredoxin-like negative regulator of GroEL